MSTKQSSSTSAMVRIGPDAMAVLDRMKAQLGVSRRILVDDAVKSAEHRWEYCGLHLTADETQALAQE